MFARLLNGARDLQASGVLMMLDRSMGPVPRILLRDAPADAQLVRPRSPEIPAPPGPGRYQLMGEVARGGMGAVLKGRDVDLGRDLAIKVILEEHREIPEVVRRFVEEAQIGGQLQHPGIIPVHELGRFPDGRLYIAMKLVRGRTLAALLVDRNAPGDDRSRFLAIFEQVCQTMAYAHSRGVVHRDLKPSNVMVGSFGEVQVMDWGLAKVLDQGGVADEPQSGKGNGMTRAAIRTLRTGSEAGDSLAGSVLGTPAYMSPEQARGAIDTVDERADVFGLGSILCEILSGAPAYAGHSGAELYRMAERADLRDTFARLDSCGADTELIALAKSCLAPAPKDRPRDAGVILAGLTAYVTGAERRLREAGLAKARAETVAAEERKRRVLAVALAASMLATGLLGAGGWAWMSNERANRIEIASKEVSRALDYADEKREQARADREGDRTLWVQAIEAARRADSLLSQGEEVSAELRNRVRSAMAKIEPRAANLVESAEKDRRMVGRLAEIHNDLGVHGDTERTDAEYAAAFRDYGVIIDGVDPAKAGAQLAASPVAAELASALDQWVFLRRLPARRDAIGAQQLVAVAKAADPEPWRNQLRDTLGRMTTDQAGALADLERLAATADVDRLPEASVTRLAFALSSLGRGAIAIALLRRAQRLHPADFWVNADLGRELGRSGRPDEAVRFFAVAVGIRPRSDLALGFLGEALLQSGQIAEAAETFRRVIALRPDDAHAHVRLGAVLLNMGTVWEADVEFAEAKRLKPADWKIRDLIGSARADAGDWLAAIEDCREAVRLAPQLPLPHNDLGFTLLGAGRADQAVDAFRERFTWILDSARTYVGLGQALLARGDFAEARDIVGRRGVMHFPDRSLDPASVVATTARRMIALDTRLPALLRSQDRPTDAREGSEFAHLCFCKKFYGVSARLWRDSFTARPLLADEPGSHNRYEAARAATLVSSGRGGDDPLLDGTTRTKRRAQALDWMKAELRGHRHRARRGDRPRQRSEIPKRLGRWRIDPDLAGLRDETPLSTLPEAERPFRKFWSDVEALRQKPTAPVIADPHNRS